MFFSDRIRSIPSGARVLDIGPGASPHPAATVLLEKRFPSEVEYVRQCGGVQPAGGDPRTVFYDGGAFPFADGEFDYVICSHVLEHVPDPEQFAAEIFRVGRAGYLEYPLIYYEFVYDIPEHVNVVKRIGDEIVYLPKRELGLDRFAEIQRFWFESLNAGYSDTVGQLVPWLMEGFEWHAPLRVRRATSPAELVHGTVSLAPRAPVPSRRRRVVSRLRSLLRIGAR